jgi:CDP-diacylglycerol--serine O-phosphatidyltransferase
MFNIPNLFTAANMLCGFVSIILALFGRIDLAPLFILAALIFDFLDGFIARKMNLQGELGKQLDSLADMVTFGIAPGIIMLVMIVIGIDFSALLSKESGTNFQNTELSYYAFIQIWDWIQALIYGVPNDFDASIKYLPFIALIIPFFSMFRLAKFNLDKRQSDRFRGVPTPLNTIFFLFFPLYFSVNLNQWEHQEKWILLLFDCYTLSVITVLFSVLMVTDIPLISLKFKTWTWNENKFRYILVGSSLIIILLFWIWAILIIVFLYLLLSLIGNYQLKKNEV